MAAELPYVIILAGGEGRRLAALTRALYGSDLPKQFAVLAGERSLLQTTVERATALTTLDRISVVVTAQQENVARKQLAPYLGVELVVQPRNLDTAPGMLLPLARILARESTARVVFLPSDHYIAHTEPIHRALRAAECGDLARRVAIVGVAPTGPEVEYGWIVRGRRIPRSSAHEVSRFREKPTPAEAEDLWRAAGLWNTFIQSGPVDVFWELAARHLPRHTAAFERYALAVDGGSESFMLEETYRAMPAASFSREVLAHAGSLAVLPVAGSGWSDWGSPARVFASLAGTEGHERLVGRIRGDLALDR